MFKTELNTYIYFFKYSVTSAEEGRIFSRYEKFLTSINYTITSDFDQIGKINFDIWRNKKKLYKVLVIKLFALLFGIRCLVNILCPTPYIRNLTCNGYHYLGNSKMINLVFLCGYLAGNIMLALSNQYLILSGQSTSFSYLNRIKHRRLDYRLNRRFNNKFYRKIQLDFQRSVGSIPTNSICSRVYCRLSNDNGLF